MLRWLALIVLCGSGVLLSVLNYIYRQTNHYKYHYGNFISYMDRMPDGLEAVALGSAQAYYDYAFSQYGEDGLGIRCGNLAGNPQALKNSIEMLQQKKYKLAQNCKVLFTPPCVLFFSTITHRMARWSNIIKSLMTDMR